MLKRKYVVIGFLAFCLAAALFVGVTISRNVANSSATSTVEYDPWCDLNDDGRISITDIVMVALHFGAEGTPFVAKAALEYDSGWLNITDKCGQYFNIIHNLSSTDVIVDITGKTTQHGGIHQIHLGGTGYTPGWILTYGGTQGDYAYSLVQTRDGGYAMAGRTNSFGAGNGDFWLVKTDWTGDMQWNRTYGGTTGDTARSVVQTSDGGYAIAGHTNSITTGYDFYLVKTDLFGNMEWSKKYGGAENDYLYSIIQTSDEGYALAGATWSFGAGGYDIWLVKTNVTGNIQWSHTYGGGSNDEAHSVIQTSDGGYAIAGTTASSGAGGYDFWLVKTYAEGSIQWSQTYGGTGLDTAYSVVQTSDGGYAIAGYTSSFGAGGADFWLVKTDANGNHQWNQTYGETYSDYAWSVVQTKEGGYAIAGTGFANIVKTDTDGNEQWSKKLTYYNAYSVVQTTEGSYALAGDMYTTTSLGTDFWLAKTDKESGIAWTDSTADTITLYRGATDPYWNYVRVRIWKIK